MSQETRQWWGGVAVVALFLLCLFVAGVLVRAA